MTPLSSLAALCLLVVAASVATSFDGSPGIHYVSTKGDRMVTIQKITAHDVRFPLEAGAGVDAVHLAPIYS